MASTKSSNPVLPILGEPPRTDGRRLSLGWRRAIILILVHALVAFHIGHYLQTGQTLSPLEPSETGQTLRGGAINAGAVFFVLLILSSLIFGRFFCGWACHLVAYQDLARWLMLKAGIRPKPFRSRLLVLVPAFAAFWLFGLPLLNRLGGEEGPPPSWELTSTDFWATFPGLGMTLLTFGVCGFLIVYVLGAKGFCTYGCPYGALFAAADRMAPGRIRVTDACTHCGVCSSVCSSNVNVAREVHLFGAVVDPGCMKCMDCVSHCPTQALHFGFLPSQKKADPRAARKEKVSRAYDFTWSEELFMAGLFAVAFAVFNNLYRTVPFLLSVGLSSITAWMAMLAVRLGTEPGMRLQNLSLKEGGRYTRTGWLAWAVLVAAGLLLLQGAFLQWNTRQAKAAYDVAAAAFEAGDRASGLYASDRSLQLFARVERWGFFHTRGAGRMAGQMHVWRREPEKAVASLRQEIDAGSRNSAVAVLLGDTLAELGREREAEETYRKALRGQWASPSSYLGLARQLAGDGKAKARIFVLRGGLDEHPGHPDLSRELCGAIGGAPASVRNAPEVMEMWGGFCKPARS